MVVEVGLQEEVEELQLLLPIHRQDQMDQVVLIMVELEAQVLQHQFLEVQFLMLVAAEDKIIEILQQGELVLQMVLVD